MRDAKIAEYQSIVGQVMLIAEHLAELDLPRILREIEHAEVLGPFVDPTLWTHKHHAMSEDKELIQAALPLRSLGQRRKEAKP
jgi:hypothetical protein